MVVMVIGGLAVIVTVAGGLAAVVMIIGGLAVDGLVGYPSTSYCYHVTRVHADHQSVIGIQFPISADLLALCHDPGAGPAYSFFPFP